MHTANTRHVATSAHDVFAQGSEYLECRHSYFCDFFLSPWRNDSIRPECMTQVKTSVSNKPRKCNHFVTDLRNENGLKQPQYSQAGENGFKIFDSKMCT